MNLTAQGLGKEIINLLQAYPESIVTVEINTSASVLKTVDINKEITKEIDNEDSIFKTLNPEPPKEYKCIEGIYYPKDLIDLFDDRSIPTIVSYVKSFITTAKECNDKKPAKDDGFPFGIFTSRTSFITMLHNALHNRSKIDAIVHDLLYESHNLKLWKK